ncbi:transcription factor Pcc1-domain-containing protein [Podospora appendiculata]|uniref:Transcription factor Pcc1-domain-containing protein n=1 Tax=Podospora appendiculata TaxID=314037 RepID=A0AAE0XHI3_9PEZI|nr:transcription factor Pcc1-domain-containing protein [Podospora appendiculata]
MATDNSSPEEEFPCSLTLNIPFPDARLASVALRALKVDKELSALVQRDLSTTTASDDEREERILHVEYRATTNRMLRVAVNSFMESVALVLEVMEELDVDVLEAGATSA